MKKLIAGFLILSFLTIPFANFSNVIARGASVRSYTPRSSYRAPAIVPVAPVERVNGYTTKRGTLVQPFL